MGRRVPFRSEKLLIHYPAGAYVGDLWVPLDIWIRITTFLKDAATQQAFGRVCAAAAVAVSSTREPDIAQVKSCFRLCAFSIPDTVIDKVLMVHVVPPRGEGLVLFVDESEGGDGVELAWLLRGRMQRVPLGLDAVPASAVSNIRFSPDGQSVALLVTLARGSVVSAGGDPLRRLRGWDSARMDRKKVFDIEYDPCEDCTVQIVDMKKDQSGLPSELILHTFSHVFVPEYGFDLVWRADNEDLGASEIAFAAMLHSEAGAATYLVRWKTFRNPTAANFIFMACIDGASAELLEDKRHAMLTQPSTVYTSRIELADDAKHVFFDTISKFGVLKFDQVDDPSKATVTRADLPNNPVINFRTFRPAKGRETFSNAVRSRYPHAAVSTALSKRAQARALMSSILSDLARISRMSPNGALLCSVVFTRRVSCDEDPNGASIKHVEMRSSLTGSLIYRRKFTRQAFVHPWSVKSRICLEKSGDVAQHTIMFSEDSSLLIVWDTLPTKTHCLVFQTLPIVLDAASGRLIQDFSAAACNFQYENLQSSPDGRTLYGTRMDKDKITMDAVDVISGEILKTILLTGPVHPPVQFSAHSIYLLPNRRLHTVSRGHVDVLWETTRGSLGCGWRSRPRSGSRDNPGCSSQVQP